MKTVLLFIVMCLMVLPAKAEVWWRVSTRPRVVVVNPPPSCVPMLDQWGNQVYDYYGNPVFLRVPDYPHYPRYGTYVEEHVSFGFSIGSSGKHHGGHDNYRQPPQGRHGDDRHRK